MAQICCDCKVAKPYTSYSKGNSLNGTNAKCKECTSRYNKAYNASPGKKAKSRDLTRKWVANNRLRHSKSMSSWAKSNPHKRAASTAKRNALKLKATVKWADKHLIEELYAESAQLSYETGVKHHVDHIIPLQGRDEYGEPFICGLHVPNNLQILTAKENVAKRSLYIPLNLLHNTLRYYYYYFVLQLYIYIYI